MMIYNVIRSSVTLSGTTPYMTMLPGANRSFMVIELDLQGMGTSSAANEVGLYKVLAAGTGGATAIANTPQPVDAPNMTGTTPAIAFSGAVNASYATTQPTFTATAPLHTCPINSNGQRYFWRANPNLNNAIVVPAIAAPNGVLFAPITGTGVVTTRAQVAEL
jgi:hypothetical protein